MVVNSNGTPISSGGDRSTLEQVTNPIGFRPDTNIIQNKDGTIRRMTHMEWVTEDETPDPLIKRVLGEYVVVRPFTLKSEIKLKSGLVVSVDEKTKQKAEYSMTVGRVVGVGEYAGKRQNVSQVKIGDFVIFPKYGGARVKIQGVKVVIMPDDSLFCVVEPEDVDISVD